MNTLRTILLASLLILFAATSHAKIVFSTSHNKNSNIYVMDDNGENIRQITDTPYYDSRTYWSPDGARIAFVRDTTLPDQEGDQNVYIIHADGTKVQQLTHYENVRMIDLAYSPDGKKLLFTQNFSNQNMVVIDSGEIIQITRSHINEIDWSPDGKQIVYVNDDHQFADKHLWIMDANGDNRRQWTESDPKRGRLYHAYPRWSSDGKQIVYFERELVFVKDENQDVPGQGRFGRSRVIIHSLVDDKKQVLEIPENLHTISLAWMDGDQTVLFSAFEYDTVHNQHPPSQIYKYDLKSNTFTHLTEGSRADWHEGPLSVSPIGKKSVRWSELKKAYTGR